LSRTPAFTTDYLFTDYDVHEIDDNILVLMLLLKEFWNLTGSDLTTSDIKFSTGWYDGNIQLPQITVTPGWNRKTVLSTGDKPMYQYQDTTQLNIWVRPKQDSATSLGQAKHIEYELRKEVERIIKALSNRWARDRFYFTGRWRTLDETNKRPVILRSMLEVKDNYFRQKYEEA